MKIIPILIRIQMLVNMTRIIQTILNKWLETENNIPHINTASTDLDFSGKPLDFRGLTEVRI